MSYIYCFEFNALLQAQRRHLLGKVREQIVASGERLDSANQTKIAEGDAPADANDEMGLTTVTRERQELQEIEAALARIRDGSYGICISCGGEISRARLIADPRAKHCPTCQIRVLPKLSTGA
jgi:RNA polymerase-binding protein DksA